MRYLLIFFLLISCNQAQNRKKQMVKVDPQGMADTIVSSGDDALRVDTFNITRLIPEFSKDTDFRNISGISVGTDIQRTVIYSIYKLPKKKLFKILSKKNVSTYTNLVKYDSLNFFKNVYGEYEQNPTAQQFYDRLRSLKKYDLYFAGSYGYMHWLFLDKNSDTIYQRTQLLTF